MNVSDAPYGAKEEARQEDVAASSAPESVAVDQMFPILGANAFVPWAFVEPHERWALKNHDQTLKRLAERGGLSWSELCAVIENRRWQAMDSNGDRNAVARVLGHLIAWYERRMTPTPSSRLSGATTESARVGEGE